MLNGTEAILGEIARECEARGNRINESQNVLRLEPVAHPANSGHNGESRGGENCDTTTETQRTKVVRLTAPFWDENTLAKWPFGGKSVSPNREARGAVNPQRQ